MRVLVTGGGGFIGSHLTRAYLDRGDEVTVLDDFSTGDAKRVGAGARVVEGDLRDAGRLLGADTFDLVNHHAAQASVARSVADPRADAATNVLGGVALLEAVGEVGQVIFASTGGAIYGEVPGAPAAEDAPLRPLSPYGAAKAAFEIILAAWGRRHGVATTALRYANVYGPGQDPDGEAGVVAAFCRVLATGGIPEVHGDGTQARDFVFVDDVVAANLTVEGTAGVYNIGTGVATSVHGLLDALAGDGSPRRRGAVRPGDLGRSVLDSAKAAREFGWRPTVGLETGLAATQSSPEWKEER